MIKRSFLFNFLFAFIVLLPVIFSFIFNILGLPVPTYLFIIIISFIAIPLIANDVLTLSKNKTKLVFYLLFTWILLSITYTPSVIASKDKFTAILYNTLFPIIIIELYFLFSRQKSIAIKDFESTILRLTYIILFFAFFAFVLFRHPAESGRYTIPGVENAIWFSRFAGMLLLIILCCTKLRMGNIILYFSAIIVALALLYGGGSRGPLLSVVIVFLIRQTYFISKTKLVLLLTFILGVIAIGFIFIGGYLFETNFYSLYARLDLVKDFSNFDFNYLRGNGIGSFALTFFGEDRIYYPHNVFLELFLENGLIGVFLFSLLLFFFFKSFKPNIVNFLCVYYLLASMVSGDIPGNNNLFILLFISSYANESSIQRKNFIEKDEQIISE